MLILDNLLLSPLLWIFREINETVQKEQAGEADAVTRSLSELYMKLETGSITEAEFEVAESALLDRLDEIRERTEGSDEEEEEEEDEEDEEDEVASDAVDVDSSASDPLTPVTGKRD